MPEDPPLNPLQAEVDRLKSEKQALFDEFNAASNPDTKPHHPNNPNAPNAAPDDNATPLAIKREITKLIPEALITLRNLLTHAESEATRSQLGYVRTEHRPGDGQDACLRRRCHQRAYRVLASSGAPAALPHRLAPPNPLHAHLNHPLQPPA
jgi:hypothetical protein